MAQNQFWLLKSPPTPKKFAEWDRGKNKLEIIKCPINDGHQRGGKRLSSLSVVLPSEANQDFVWTWLTDCLIQNHTLHLLHEFNFTGFEVKPIEARFKKSINKPPKLWEIVLTGWAGVADPASGIHLDKPNSCPACGLLCYTPLLHPQLLINEKQWDGSDFFMVWPMPRFIFVTEKVVQFIREHNLTGIQVESVSFLKIEDSGFGPGRLSYWMPDQRARELGEPLGIY